MRTLSAKSDAARQLRGYTCVAGLQVTFGGAAGTKWFTAGWAPADVDAEQLRRSVSSWGDISQQLSRGKEFCQAAGKIVLLDHTGELREWWDAIEFQKLAGELRWGVYTPGEAAPNWADASVVLSVTVVPPTVWHEADRTIELELTDISPRARTTIGLVVTRENSPLVRPEDEGRIVPLVYGTPERVSAISYSGPRAHLVKAISQDDTQIWVDDASRFPQGEEITIVIGKEEIVGSFTGNCFLATERGRVLFSGTTTQQSLSYMQIISTLLCTYPEGSFVGYMLEMAPNILKTGGNAIACDAYGGQYTPDLMIFYGGAVGGGFPPVLKEITHFDPTTGTVSVATPWTIPMGIERLVGDRVDVSGYQIKWKYNASFKIRTAPESHDKGEAVMRVGDNITYVGGRGAGVVITQVYIHAARNLCRVGQASAEEPLQQNLEDALTIGARVGGTAGPTPGVPSAPSYDWMPLPPEMWSPSTVTIDGVSCAGVALTRGPMQMGNGWQVDSEEILVDMNGPTEAGPVMRNPASIIAHIANAYAGVTLVHADAQASLDNWRMDFALAEERDVWDLVAELAYLARCRIVMTTTTPRLAYQLSDGGTPLITIGDEQRFVDSLERSREELELGFSEVVVNWTERGKSRRYNVRDSAAESRLGRRILEVDAWPYTDYECPRSLARYLLRRYSHLHDVVRVDATVAGVAIEPGDIISVNSDLLPDPPHQAEVESVSLGHGRAPDRPSVTRINARLHRWAGCSLSCEGSCETAGCETSCESGIEPGECWTCETSCQSMCEDSCQSGAELMCSENDCESNVTAGCASQCMVSTMIITCGWLDTETGESCTVAVETGG